MRSTKKQKTVSYNFTEKWQETYAGTNMEMSKTHIFFNRLVHYKKSKTKDSEYEEIAWEINRLAGLLYFEFGKMYQNFITKITKYYPFSLLYRDRIYHYQFQLLRKRITKIEKLVKKFGINLLITHNEIHGNYTVYKSIFTSKPDPKKLKQLEHNLQTKFSDVFVRKNKNGISFIFPKEDID